MPAPGRRPRCPSGSAAAALGRRRRPPRAWLGPAGRRRSAGRARAVDGDGRVRLPSATASTRRGPRCSSAGRCVAPGMRTAAATTLEGARAQLAAMHAAPWAAQAAAELERVAPGRAEGTLTTTESRIADLVAQGRRNREIAGELLISLATVEAHLTRIYRKLGVRSRTELVGRIASATLHPADCIVAGVSGNPATAHRAASIRSIHAANAFDVRRGRPTGAAARRAHWCPMSTSTTPPAHRRSSP